MRYSEKALNIVTALKYCKGIGPAWINKNVKAISDVNNAWERISLSTKQDFSFDSFIRYRETIQYVFDRDEFTDGVVVIGDDEFPVLPEVIKGGERPVALFYKGDILLLHNLLNNVAVIGVLNPTDAIVEREKAFVRELIIAGFNIVSGLAKGCDSIAHKQALDSDGVTIAILPGTLRNITPSENRQLAHRIVSKNGLLVTEYFEEVASKKELIDRYIKRDRLQAMFSKAVCLTASYAPNDLGNDSGSRHAMGKAKDYNILRYVMYNKEKDYGDPQFALNRKLLEDPGVRIITAKSIAELSQETNINSTLFG